MATSDQFYAILNRPKDQGGGAEAAVRYAEVTQEPALKLLADRVRQGTLSPRKKSKGKMNGFPHDHVDGQWPPKFMKVPRVQLPLREGKTARERESGVAAQHAKNCKMRAEENRSHAHGGTGRGSQQNQTKDDHKRR